MKILVLDIETKPLDVWTWGMWNQNVGLIQMKDRGGMISWAAKWVGDDRGTGGKQVMFMSDFHHGVEEMAVGIHMLLDEADVVVHFNGKRFDIPHINTAILASGLGPPSPYKQLDLLHIFRRNFKLPSNKLQAICAFLGIGSKTQHTGFQLWIDCMNGCKKAWGLMRKYNKHDVELTEELYHRLLPWIKHHPHKAPHADAPSCPNCGGTNLHRRGYAVTNAGITYRRYQCQCGKWVQGATQIKKRPKHRTSNA